MQFAVTLHPDSSLSGNIWITYPFESTSKKDLELALTLYFNLTNCNTQKRARVFTETGYRIVYEERKDWLREIFRDPPKFGRGIPTHVDGIFDEVRLKTGLHYVSKEKLVEMSYNRELPDSNINIELNQKLVFFDAKNMFQ